MACSHEAPNGQSSILYQQLEQRYGADRAHDYWTAVRSQQFLNEHGDWTADSSIVPLDENGEPTFEWVRTALELTEPTPAQERQMQEVNFDPEKPVSVAERAPEETYLQKIQDLYEEAIANPDKLYKVTYKYEGEKRRYASGYTAREMADMFDKFQIPSNVIFDAGFYRLIMNSSGRIKREFFSDAPVELMQRDEEWISQDMQMLLISKIDENGKVVGYFTPQEQQDIVDSIKFLTHQQINRDPNIGTNALIKTFYLFQQKAYQLSTQQPDSALANNYAYIFRQRVKLAEEVLRGMEALGVFTDAKTKAQLLRNVDSIKPLTGEQITELDSQVSSITMDEVNPESGNFMEVAARGLRDWSDLSFELDPKDTASAQMKMFIATLPEMETAVYTVGEEGVSIDPDTVMIGEETLSDLIRTEGTEQAFELWKEGNPANLQNLLLSSNRRSLWMKNQKLSEQLVQFARTNYPLVPQTNFLGIRKIVDFEATFQDVLELLADVPQSFDEYMTALENSGKPNLQYLAKELQNMDESFQNGFAKVMSKQYQEFVMVLFNRTKTDDVVNFTLNPINANRYSQKNTIIKNWQSNQKISPIMILNEAGARVMDVKRIRERWLPILKDAQAIVDWSNSDNIDWAKDAMQQIFQLSGITMTDEMMDYLFDNMEDLTRQKMTGGIGTQFSVTQDGKPTGIFSAFILKSAGMTEQADIQDTDVEEALNRAEIHNPLYTEGYTMRILATVAAKFTPVLHSSSHRSSEGKNVWDYGLHTKLSHKFNDFKNDFYEQLKKYEETDIARDNILLKVIQDTPARLNAMKLNYLDGLKPTWGKRGTTRPSMSDREQLLTSISLFQNRGYGFNTNSKVHYMSLSHSDKTTTPVFMNMPRFDAGRVDGLPLSLLGNIGSILYNIFKSEHSRIINQKDIAFNNDRYQKGKGLFYFLPNFNYDAMQDLVAAGKLSEREFKTIWLGGQRNLTPIITNDAELTVINKVLGLSINDMVNDTISVWFDNGIANDEGYTFDQKYVTKLLATNNIYKRETKTPGGSVYMRENQSLTEEQVRNIVILGAARDYTINHFIFNTSLSQLFYGDPAQTYKGKPGTHELAQVSATMKEYAKRLAKDIAPGQDPYWTEDKKEYNSITLKDVKPSESYLNAVSDTLGKAYGEVEGTDAQELITVQEDLDVRFAMGEINKDVYDAMSQIITDAGPGGYYEFTIPEHKAVIMKPSKPVYSGQRLPDNGAAFEDYIKSSSYPLYPPITAGTNMEGLRRMMETNGIARANFESAKKIGLPVQPLQVFSKDGTFTMPSVDSIAAATQRLSRDGFRIQQEVPYDEEKEAIRTVTQMNKLIVEGIDIVKSPFTIRGKEYTPAQIRQYKEAIRSQMIAQQRDIFLQKFSVDAKNSGDYTILDKNQVYNILADEARKKGYTLNELQSLLLRDDEGNPLIPLMFNTAADRLEILMMSMVKKIVDVKMPGKSFVQASSVGYTFTSEKDLDKSGIVWSEGYDGAALKTLRHEKGVVKPAQVLVPFNFFDESGNALNIDDYTKNVNGKRVIDTEKLPVELLQMVGARIPNQGHNSMIPIEIVGFLPKQMGDLVIVPSALTKQMGADFDVDKLFTYKRNYKVSEEGVLRELVMDDDVRVLNPEQLQSAYFDVHWSILMHPDMTEKILKPLDKPDLEEENKKLASTAQLNYFSPMAQLADYQSGKEAKKLVGLTSLSVTFNSVIQNKDLELYQIVSDQTGRLTELPMTIDIRSEFDDSVLALSRLSGTGISWYAEKDGQLPGQEGLRTKHDNLTTLQSAAVDNAKNRTLDNLNLSTNTYPAAAALVQLETGERQAANLKYVTRLLTQPIIKEFDKAMKVGNDSLSESYTPNLKAHTIQDLKDKLLPGTSEAERAIIQAIKDQNPKYTFSPQQLLRIKSLEPGTPEYKEYQYAVLDLFERLDSVGQRLSELQAEFNQDTNGAGPSILNSMDKRKKLQTLDIVPIKNASSIQRYLNPSAGSGFTNTEQGNTFNYTIETANNVITQLLPYDKLIVYQPSFTNSEDGYINIFEHLATLGGKTNLNFEQQRNVIRAFRSFTYSNTNWWENAQVERARLFFGRKQSKESSLAERVLEAKRTWGKDNYFLQRLDSRIGATEDAADYVEYQAASVSRIDEENNNRGWLSMLVSDSEEQRRLGEDLIRYAYLTGGIQDANSFVKFVPVAYIVNTPFGDMLRQKMRQLNATDESFSAISPSFVSQYFQHNPDMAMQLDTYQMKGILSMMGQSEETNEYAEVFQMPDLQSPTGIELNTGKYYIQNTETGYLQLVPYVSFRSQTEGKWLLYALKYTTNGAYYVRIDTLGNSATDEYNAEAGSGIRSLFSENRGMAQSVNSDGGMIAQFKNNMLGGYYTGVSNYDAINLQEGGTEEISTSLRSIIDNPAIPQYMRTYAKFMNTEGANGIADVFANFTFEVDEYKPRIVFDRSITVAGVAELNGTIKLNPNSARSATEAAEVLLHELTHQRIQSIIMATGFDPRVDAVLETATPEQRKRTQERMAKFQSMNPDLVKSVAALERIRYEALTELRNQLGVEAVDQLLVDLAAGNMTSENHIIAYALSDVHELTSAVMTASPVAQFLNGIESKRGKSFMAEIWDALVNIIEAMAKSFGFKVNDNSLLKEAITHTLKLSAERKSLDFSSATIEETTMNTSIEEEADSAVEIMNTVFNKEAIKKEYPSLFSVHITNKAITPSTNTQVAKIMAKLTAQLKEAGREVSRAKTKEDKVAARIRYKELEDSLIQLEQEQDIELIGKIGNKQLQWIDKVLKNPDARALDVQAALNAANIWSGIIELLYNQRSTVNAKAEFAQLQADAQVRRRDLINRSANRVVTESLKGVMTLEPQDFSSNIVELNKAEADWLTLTRAKSKLAQGIGVIGRQAANNRDEDIRLMVNRLTDIEKRLKKTGFQDNILIQDEAWGLVQRLSDSWYRFNNLLVSDRTKDLERISKLKLSSEAARNSRRNVWEKFWKEFTKKAVFVDVRKFFDLVGGTRKENPAAFEELAKIVGSTEYANELVEQAADLVQKYIEERELAKEYYEMHTVLTSEESATLSMAEQDALFDKRVEEAYQRWLHFNSPQEFLDLMDGSKSPGNLSGDRWLVSAPRTSYTEFYDDKYNTINSNPELVKVYEDFKELIQEMISYLPATEKEKLNPDFLPIVSTETMNTLATMVGKIRNFDATLMNAFAATEDEELGRIQANEIPIRYTRMTNRAEAVGISRDVIRVAEVFSMMALHYKHMAPVLDEINVTESIINEVNRQRVAGEIDGPTLRNMQDSITYFKDALIYKKPRLLEGKVDNPIYSMNPATQLKMQNEVKKLYQRKIDLEKSILKENDQGNIQTEDLEQELEKVNEQLDEFSKQAHNIYGSKAVDTLISVNQLKALGYNPFSAISNFSFGMVSVFIHGAAGVDYSGKDTRRAMGIMLNATQKYVTFGTAENDVAKKITALFDKSGILGDIVDSSFGRTNLETRKGGALKSALAPFNWQRSGDYFAKGTMMIAMMLKKQVTVTEQATGETKTISLWDALDNEGNWNEDKYGTNPEWTSDEPGEQVQWNRFRDKIRKLGIMVFGNQDKNAPLLARKSYLKRLVGQFRMSWLPEGIATRWLDERYDAELGRTVKGRWRTFPDLGVVTAAGVLVKQLIAKVPGVKSDPFEGVLDKKGNPISEIDIENMRKNFAGLAWTIAFGASIVMIRAFYEDDKKRGKKKAMSAMQRQLMLNMLIRNYQDLKLYSSPSVIDTVTGNLLPATAVLNDAWKAIAATAKYVAENEKDAKAMEAWLDKVMKAFPVANLYPKTKYMMKRDLDAISQ